MRFWFCDKCNMRVVDSDIGEGAGAQIDGVVLCKYCAKTEIVEYEARNRFIARPSAMARRTSTALIATRSIASAQRPHSNTMLYFVFACVTAMLGLGMIFLSGSPARESNRVAALSSGTAEVKVRPASIVSPAPPGSTAEPAKTPAPVRERDESMAGPSQSTAKLPVPPLVKPMPEVIRPPDFPREKVETLIQRAVQLESSGKFAEALASYDSALKQYPDNAELYSNRGNVRLNMGDCHGALLDAESALRRKKFWNAYAVKAIASAGLGQDTDYRFALGDALALVADPNKKNIEALIVASARNARLEYAGKELEERLPMSAEEYLTRAQFRARHKRSREAMADFEAAMNADPALGNKGVYSALAELAGQDGDLKARLAYYQRWQKASPELPDALNALAWELLTSKEEALRDDKAALPLAKKANDLTQDRNPSIMDTYALALFRNGLKSEAAAMQKRALEFLAFDAPATMREEFEQHLRRFQESAP